MSYRKITEKKSFDLKRYIPPVVFNPKDDNSSSSNPFKNPKKKEEPNLLFEVNSSDNSHKAYIFDRKSLWEVILRYFMTLIGKGKEWEDAKLNLKQMQSRINKIETLIKTSSPKHHLKEKSYKI